MIIKRPVVTFLTQLLLAICSRFTRRAPLKAENLLFRQELVVLQRKSPKRVRLWNKPETVIRWHQRGFRAYWRWKSRHIGGRPRINAEVRALIRRMSRENPLRGAPRIHGELLMLGI